MCVSTWSRGIWFFRTKARFYFDLGMLWVPLSEQLCPAGCTRAKGAMPTSYSHSCRVTDSKVQDAHLHGKAFGHGFGRLEELTCWKRPWCWEGLGAGGEGDDRRWDGWMASLTRWAWVWVNSGSLWWTGGPGVLRFMGLQRVGHD